LSFDVVMFMFQEVCVGVQRGGGGALSPGLWGGLLSSLAERALMLRYRLPEGRSWKRLWEGWVGSFTMLFALLEHHVRKMSRMEGRGAPMSAGGSCRCTTVPVPDSDAAGQHALNGSPVESGEDGWRETCSFKPVELVCVCVCVSKCVCVRVGRCPKSTGSYLVRLRVCVCVLSCPSRLLSD